MNWSDFTRKVLVKDKGKKGRIWKAFYANTPFLVKEYFAFNGSIPSWAAAEIRFGTREPDYSGLAHVFSEEETVFLAYRWIEGINLKDLKDRQRFWQKKLPYAALFKSMAESVHALHQKGYLHLDLRPSNFMYLPDSGKIKLIDFGSVRNQAELALGQIPEFGMHYASPELLLKKASLIDQRSDYYGLGLTMAYLLSGKHPFSDQHPEIIKSRMLSENLQEQDYGPWGDAILRLSAKQAFPKPPAQLEAAEVEAYLKKGLNLRAENLHFLTS
ncbi:MAG: hypothetical protein EP332_03780 [Bacteroidetes bacterium]|nr:MAG: hypothetical protein EP332_03780 [Bacteroidota bacterium]